MAQFDIRQISTDAAGEETYRFEGLQTGLQGEIRAQGEWSQADSDGNGSYDLLTQTTHLSAGFSQVRIDNGMDGFPQAFLRGPLKGSALHSRRRFVASAARLRNTTKELIVQRHSRPGCDGPVAQHAREGGTAMPAEGAAAPRTPVDPTRGMPGWAQAIALRPGQGLVLLSACRSS